VRDERVVVDAVVAALADSDPYEAKEDDGRAEHDRGATDTKPHEALVAEDIQAQWEEDSFPPGRFLDRRAGDPTLSLNLMYLTKAFCLRWTLQRSLSR